MNKILFKFHRILAFIVCLPLLLISLSGSVLVFKHEIDALLMPERVRVDFHDHARQPFDVLLHALNSAYPNYEVTGWQVFADRGRADLVYVMAHGGSDWSSVFVDPYQVKILTVPTPPKYYFTDWVREFHCQFLTGTAGLLIAAIVAVLLCVQATIGLILHRKFWKVRFTFRYRARPIIYLGDAHKLLGVIVAPILLVLGFTGAFWNISQLTYRMGAPPVSEDYIVGPHLYNPALSIDGLVKDSQMRLLGLTPSFISLPSKPGYGIGILGGVAGQNAFFSEFANSVRYHAQSGDVLSVRDIRESGVKEQVKNSFRRLHFGDFAGDWSRVVWALAGLSPVILIATGLAMWRIRRPRRRRQAEKQ